MPRTERNFEESFKNLKRDVSELKRNSQASMVGYVDNKTGKIEDILNEIDVDTRVPAAPVEVVADSFVYESYNAKRRQGYITLTSAPVVNATDATPIEIGSYQMWLRPGGYTNEEDAEPFALQGTAVQPSLRSLPVEIGKPYEVTMRAMTITGRPGLFSEVKTVTVIEDTSPPPMPSALTLSQSLGVIDMMWNGLSFGDTLMPLDFWRTEIGVRWGEATEYTLIGEQFEEAGTRYYGGAPFNTQIYVAHRSQDYSGNYSEWSQPASIVVTPVVNNDEIAQRLEQAETEIDRVAADLLQNKQELDGKLNQAQTDLDAAEANLNNLNTVVIPGINQTLSNTQTELDQTAAQLTGRLDDAFVEIDSANAASIQASQDAQAAQDAADEARRRADNAAQILTNKIVNPRFLNGEEDWLFRGEHSFESGMGMYVGAAFSGGTGTYGKSAEIWSIAAYQPDVLFVNGASSNAAVSQVWRTTWTIYGIPGPSAQNPKLTLYLRALSSAGSLLSESKMEIPAGLATHELEITVPANGYFLSVGMVSSVDGTASSSNFSVGVVREVSLQNVTELESLEAIAKKAEQDALKAQQDAGTALSNAQSALTAAGTKTTSYVATTNPVGTGKVKGDTWRRVDSNGNVIGVWIWDGAWKPSLLRSEAIDNLDVGKLTASSATISSAVIEKLWAEVITARKISVSQLMVGSFDNLCPDPSFESFDLPEFSGGSVWTDDNAGGAEFTRDPGARTGSAWLRTTRTTAGLVNSFYNRALIQVNGGDTFKFGLWYKVLSGTGSARVRIYEYGANGQYLRSSLTGGDELTADGWTRSSATRTIAADARYIRIRAQITVGDASQVAVDDMYCNRMTDGSIIVNGSITGDHLEVNSVAAKVATVLKLDVGNLVASNAAINTAVIDKLWTDVIRARQISADQINIGSGNNIVPNASFMNDKAWDGFGYAPVSKSAYLTGTKTIRTPSFPVEGGVPYIFKMKALSEVASRLYVQIIHNGGGSNPYVVNNFNFAPVGTVWLWRDFSVEFTLPDDATSAEIQFYGNHSGGGVTTGTQWYKDVGIYPMTDASLVVDGAILARHITASESMSAKLGQFLTVEADMIAANAVTAAKIAGGAIDGKIITGATVRTSSASSRVEMNSTGLHAWKSGVKTFFLESSTGEFSAVGSIQTGSDLTYRAKLSNRDGLAALDIYAAGGDSANHAALIAWEDSLALRRYTSATAYNGELSMGSVHVQLASSNGDFSIFSGQTKASHSSGSAMVLSSGATTLTHSNGTSLVSLGTVSQMEHANGNLYMSSSYFQFGKTNDGYIRFDSSKTTLGNRAGQVMMTEVSLDGTYTIQMPMVTASKTTQGANINSNVGYIREVSSASRYKLMTEAMDDSLDDKLLQVQAKTWVDRSNAEIYAQALTPTQEGQERIPVPTDCLRRVPGVIAEEVLAAGLEEFVIFGESGEIEGVMYDRLGVALIPVVARLRDRVVALEGEREGILARLEALESATV